MKNSILRSVGKVYELSENSKLEGSLFENPSEELDIIAKYFDVSQMQACLVSVIMVTNYERCSADISDLAHHFDCNPVRVLEYYKDLEELEERGILRRTRSRGRRRVTGGDISFLVHEKILQAVIFGEPFTGTQPEDFKDEISVLDAIFTLGEQKSEGEISSRELFNLVREVIKSNLHFPLIKRIDQLHLADKDQFLYLLLIWENLTGNNSLDISQVLRVIVGRSVDKVRYMQEFMRGEVQLTQKDLCELVNSDFVNDAEVRLTKTSVSMLQECGLKLPGKSNKSNDLLAPERVNPCELIYDEEEMKQLRLLEEMLGEANLAKIQKRLAGKNLPKGVTALFHGAPGTGKTESVMQLARTTGRAIMKVDISQSKSMWFGESEKIIKRIFTDYADLAESCERLPVLLFNEADAIFSRRRSMRASNVAQTENAIQNIILEELEKFNGILIATTNLTGNLDAAFERRFLFKVKFKEPGTRERVKMWKQKLPGLPQEDCKILATRFVFTGAQIDNIVRKTEIEEIVYGKHPEIAMIIGFCEEELLEGSHQRMGFR